MLVDLRRSPGCELAIAIGHELRHALEVPRQPGIRTSADLFQFAHRTTRTVSNVFETAAAIAAGSAVAREARSR